MSRSKSARARKGTVKEQARPETAPETPSTDQLVDHFDVRVPSREDGEE